MNVHFHPDDYPAYTFDPETGTPTRVARPARGPYAHLETRTVRPVTRKCDGREAFHLQRKDGKYRIISRSLILATLNPFADTPAPKPPELPPWSFDIQGFAGYALVLDPFSVIRYDNPATGPVNPPTKLKPVHSRRHTLDRTYEYTRYGMVDENTGRRRYVQVEKLMELAGVTMADLAAAHARHLETQGPVPRPPATRTPVPESGIQTPCPGEAEAALHEASMLAAFGPHGQG